VLREEHERHEKSRSGFYVEPAENSCERVLAKFLWEHAKVCDSEYYATILKIVIFMYKYLDEEVVTEYCKSKDCEELPCEMNGFMQYLKVQYMIDKKGDILGLKS